MKKIAMIVATALAVGGGAVSVWSASSPTTAPAQAPVAAPAQDAPIPPWQERRARPEGFRPDGMMRGGGDRPRPPGWWRGDNNPTTRSFSEEEWTYVDRFMKTYSPNRWAKFTDLPDDDRKARLKGIIANRYRTMQDLRQNDANMFDLRLKRVRIEDQIFELGWKLNHSDSTESTTNPATAAPTTGPTAEEMRSRLRELVRELVRNRIDEREARVAQLKDKLESESNRLKEEKANQDRAIEASLNAIQKQRWPGMNEMVPPMPSGAAPANASEQK